MDDQKKNRDEYLHVIGNVAEMILEKGVVKGGKLATYFSNKFSIKTAGG